MLYASAAVSGHPAGYRGSRCLGLQIASPPRLGDDRIRRIPSRGSPIKPSHSCVRVVILVLGSLKRSSPVLGTPDSTGRLRHDSGTVQALLRNMPGRTTLRACSFGSGAGRERLLASTRSERFAHGSRRIPNRESEFERQPADTATRPKPSRPVESGSAPGNPCRISSTPQGAGCASA